MTPKTLATGRERPSNEAGAPFLPRRCCGPRTASVESLSVGGAFSAISATGGSRRAGPVAVPSVGRLPHAKGRWKRTLLLAVLMLAGAGAAALPEESGAAPASARYAGRPLVEVLEEFRARGLRLIWSSAVVTPDQVVTVEPESEDGRTALEEILRPLGLEARDSGSGSITIIRAQTQVVPGSVSGRIVSASTGRGIPGATVLAEGTEKSAVTGPDGTFRIDGLPPGLRTLGIEAEGFAGASLTRLRIRSGGLIAVEIGLEALPSLVAEVVVTPGSLPVIRHEQTIEETVGRDQAVLVPTIGGDLTRLLEQLPGVAAPDNSAVFHLRGGTTRDVTMILDGLELYEPFHLQWFQSPFSIVDGKRVSDITLVGGGFPAEFGDRHGGFVSLTTADPGPKIGGLVELGTLNSRAGAGGPLGRSNGSWLVSGRAWYPEVFGTTIQLGETGIDPRFWDLFGRIALPVSDRTTLSASGLVASDHFRFHETGGGEMVDSSSRTDYLWLQAHSVWSAAFSTSALLWAGRIERTRNGVSEPEDEAVIVDDVREAALSGLRSEALWNVGDKHLLKAGADLRYLSADYRYSAVLRSDPDPPPELVLDPSGLSMAVFGAWRTALSPSVAVEAGVRWDRQEYTHDHQWSPRLNMVWRPADSTELRVAAGRYAQSQRVHELRVEDGQTEFEPAEQSRQIEASLTHRSPGGARLRVDGWYKSLFDVHTRSENMFNPVELFPETESDRVTITADRARLRGLEALLQSPAPRALEAWISAGWSRADDVERGVSYPRSWDQTWSLRGLVGWRPDDRWLLALSMNAHTGWPTTPVTGEVVALPGGGTEAVAVVGKRNSDRYRDYLRFDLKAGRSFPLRKGRLRADLDIVNLTDRNNVCCIGDLFPVERGDGTVDVNKDIGFWLGITPSFSVLWEF